MWKPQADAAQTFSFSGLQLSGESYPFTPPGSLFSPASKPSSIGFNGNTAPSQIPSSPGSVGFNGSTGPLPLPRSTMYWPASADPQTESFSASINKEPSRKKQEMSNGNGCRLFGIQLIESYATAEESSPAAAASVVQEDRPLPSQDVYSEQHSQPLNANQSEAPAVSSEPEKSCLRSPQETQSRQLRSCTKVSLSKSTTLLTTNPHAQKVTNPIKVMVMVMSTVKTSVLISWYQQVHMHGMAVGRAVDLTRFDGHVDLLRKLEEMFSIEGELTSAAKKWQVVYTDDEDDMMLVGDDPWQ